MYRFVYLLIILLVFPSLSWTLDATLIPAEIDQTDKKISQFMLDRWIGKDGLPVNTLLEISQTKDGYLWISSYDGLVRFDGLKFELYSGRLLEVINNNVCKALCLDKDGVLWVGTHGSGIFSYADGQFASLDSEKEFTHHVNKLFVDSQNGKWIGTVGHGAFILKNQEIVRFSDNPWFVDKTISSFAEDTDGNIWIGTEGAGLARWNDGELTVYDTDDGLLSDMVYTLSMDETNTLWIGTDKGICTLNQNGILSLKETEGLVCRAMSRDPHGNFWFGFDGAISRYNPKTGSLETLSKQAGFGTVAPKDLYIDREENIWIASRFGELIRLRDSNFSSITEHEGLRGKTLYTIIELEPGKLLTGSNEGYLDLIDSGGISPYGLDSELLGERIRHILKDSSGRIWISTYSGLLRIEANGTLKWFTVENGFPDQRVRIAFEDSQGRIWVGNRGKGLLRMNPDDSFITIDPEGSLTNAMIMSIQEDKTGSLWIGTSGNGLVEIRQDGSSKAYSSKTGFISDIVFNTFTDDENVIWAACNGGIARIENGSVRGFNSKDGLFSDSPYDIVEDNNGVLWIPCNIGIMKIEKSRFADYIEGKIESLPCRLFDQYDGLNAPFTATAKLLLTEDGTIWLPSFEGLCTINTNSIVKNEHEPICHVTQVTVDNQIIPLQEEIIIEPGFRRIRFDYTGLSLMAPNKVKFQSMLEGYEKEWSTISWERNVSYTNLPPGRYSFKIKASNNDGVWSSDVKNVSFVVKPSLFQQLWFQVIFIVALLAIAGSIIQNRVQQMKRKQFELEQTVVQRTEEVSLKNKLLERQTQELQEKNIELKEQKTTLEQMNEELEFFSHAVSHDLRSPLNIIKGYADLLTDEYSESLDEGGKDFIYKIKNQTRSMQEMISGLLDLAKATRTPLIRKEVNLSLMVKDILLTLRNQEKREYVHTVIAPNVVAQCDEGLVNIILENLIRNAWKYSRYNGGVEIEFGSEQKGNNTIYFVKDKGAGFDMKDEQKLFAPFERLHGKDKYEGFGLGLSTVKKIVERHGGRIWAEGEIGKGATFYFSLKG